MSIDDLFPDPDAPGDARARRATGDTGSSASDAPLIRARGLELSSRRSRVFGPLDWQVDAGELGVVVGQQGSGRSALLLALGGRMRGVTGVLQVADDGRVVDGIANPRQLQHITSVARISSMVDVERLLTVGESVDERCITEGVNRRAGRERFHALKQELGLDLDGETLIEELSAPLRTLTTALLACLAPAAYALLDDADASLTRDQFSWVVDKLQTLGDLGHTFVISALNTSLLPEDAAVLDLDALAADHQPVLPELRAHRPSHARPTTDADLAREAAAGPVHPTHALPPDPTDDPTDDDSDDAAHGVRTTDDGATAPHPEELS